MVMPLLIEGLKDKNPQARRAAAYVLGQLGPAAKEGIPALNTALKDDNADVRQAATVALEKIRAK
jgi:HEAT repeat protein